MLTFIVAVIILYYVWIGLIALLGLIVEKIHGPGPSEEELYDIELWRNPMNGWVYEHKTPKGGGKTEVRLFSTAPATPGMPDVLCKVDKKGRIGKPIRVSSI